MITVSDVKRLGGARHAFRLILIESTDTEDMVVVVGAIKSEHALAGDIRKFLPLVLPKVIHFKRSHRDLSLSATCSTIYIKLI